MREARTFSGAQQQQTDTGSVVLAAAVVAMGCVRPQLVSCRGGVEQRSFDAPSSAQNTLAVLCWCLGELWHHNSWFTGAKDKGVCVWEGGSWVSVSSKCLPVV